MAKERPINADVPAGASRGHPPPSAPLPAPSRRRRALPLAAKLIGGAVVVAAAFVVAAILGGGGGGSGLEGAAPVIGGGESPAGGGSGGQPAERPAPSTQTAEELGYPGFATKNTTRVGGDSPAADAAGAALAVFPSTSGGQRPAAVALVGEGDWAGGIAAAVLTAAPVRAPILFAGPNELPAASIEALAALAPVGSPATHGASLFSIGGARAPGGSGPVAVEGSGAAGIAAAVARLRERLTGRAPAHYVVAPARRPAFAMPAAAWAARSGDPVLFTGPKKLSPETAALLRAHPHVPAFVLGPSSAISSAVVRRIARLTEVHRVSGATPVANAVAFARYRRGDFGWNVNDPGHGFVVARSDEPLAAAAAAPLSASGTWGPLLLTDDAATLPSALRGYFLDVKPGYTEDPTRAFYNHVWVIGDQEAIGVAEQAEIDGLAELAKIGGKP